MNTVLIIALLVVLGFAALAFLTLPAAVKVAVENALRAHLDTLPQEAAIVVKDAHSELAQLELDAKDIVDKARAKITGPTS